MLDLLFDLGPSTTRAPNTRMASGPPIAAMKDAFGDPIRMSTRPNASARMTGITSHLKMIFSSSSRFVHHFLMYLSSLRRFLATVAKLSRASIGARRLHLARLVQPKRLDECRQRQQKPGVDQDEQHRDRCRALHCRTVQQRITASVTDKRSVFLRLHLSQPLELTLSVSLEHSCFNDYQIVPPLWLKIYQLVQKGERHNKSNE